MIPPGNRAGELIVGKRAWLVTVFSGESCCYQLTRSVFGRYPQRMKGHSVSGGGGRRYGPLAERFAYHPLWVFIFATALAEWVSPVAAIWAVALLSFCAFREYISLVAIRLEDRWGILVSFCSIPFMFYLVQIDWYGLFIISVPVYTFLLVPCLVALGGTSKGMLFSIGLLDFGLFFYIFCLGHFAYLLIFATPLAVLMLALVVVVDFIYQAPWIRSRVMRLGLMWLACGWITALVAPWVALPWVHAVTLGVLIPLAVCLGRFTLSKMEEDMGIRDALRQPGRGRLICSLKSYLFLAPLFFHYLRWFFRWGDL